MRFSLNAVHERGAVKDQLEALIMQMYKSGILYSEAVREFKKKFILTVLQENKGNQCKAARQLGMHRNTLSRTIAELELDIKACAAARAAPAQRVHRHIWRRKPRANRASTSDSIASPKKKREQPELSLFHGQLLDFTYFLCAGVGWTGRPRLTNRVAVLVQQHAIGHRQHERIRRIARHRCLKLHQRARCRHQLGRKRLRHGRDRCRPSWLRCRPRCPPTGSSMATH